MSNPPTKNAAVRRGLLRNRSVPEGLSLLDVVCSTGEQSPEVQGSAIGQETLTVLQKTVTALHGSSSNRKALAQALLVAIKTQALDFLEVKRALTTYEAAVGAIARGDAAVILRAGLSAREETASTPALEKVSEVSSKPGKRVREAILSWPESPGATSYAIEVNCTPETPSGAWVALTSGTRRSRVVKGPTPGCQFLARVAALGSDGTQSDWSDEILATAR